MSLKKRTGSVCPSCGRDNSEYGNICTSDDCPAKSKERANKMNIKTFRKQMKAKGAAHCYNNAHLIMLAEEAAYRIDEWCDNYMGKEYMPAMHGMKVALLDEVWMRACRMDYPPNSGDDWQDLIDKVANENAAAYAKRQKKAKVAK